MTPPTTICGYCNAERTASACTCTRRQTITTARREELNHAHRQDALLMATHTQWPAEVLDALRLRPKL